MRKDNLTSRGVETVTPLHDMRLDAVVDVLQKHRVSSVLDLGCGDGALLVRLAAVEHLEKLTGIDLCEASLTRAQKRLAEIAVPSALSVCVFQASFTSYDARLEGFEAAVLLETIEHIEPDHLSQIENALFVALRPPLVIITTPNKDYNALLGVPPDRLRHPDHRFEWGAQKFQSWCEGIAQRHEYAATFQPVGGCHPQFGGPTQMGIFKKR